MATVELKGEEWKKFTEAEYAVIDCYGENCYACVLLAPIFDAVADGTVVTRAKPDPEVFLRAPKCSVSRPRNASFLRIRRPGSTRHARAE